MNSTHDENSNQEMNRFNRQHEMLNSKAQDTGRSISDKLQF